MEITAPLYLTEIGAVGYAEYENTDKNIFMFEPEYLEEKFGSIPPYITVTISTS